MKKKIKKKELGAEFDMKNFVSSFFFFFSHEYNALFPLRCGSYDHLARDCPDSKTQCYNCNEMGHIARDCHMEATASA